MNQLSCHASFQSDSLGSHTAWLAPACLDGPFITQGHLLLPLWYFLKGLRAAQHKQILEKRLV
jgi:hypothetical protein